MPKFKLAFRSSGFLGLSCLAALLLTACQSSNPSTPPAQTTPAAPMPSASAPAQKQNVIRIKAGSTTAVKDADGNTWLADQGFADGDTADRPDLKIENTKNPMLYLSERYSMTSFSYAVPNGKYVVKLYFAETYEGITGAGQRVFSVTVQGHEIKDLDPWAKSGGSLRADVETVPIEVTDGKVHIEFHSNVENPEINAVEIIPQA